jgi:hypothetical protein
MAKKKPQTAAEIKASIFSNAEDANEADLQAESARKLSEYTKEKRISQRPQDKPAYDVSNLARNLRGKIALAPVVPKPSKNAPYRVATETIGENGILARSRVTTPRQEIETARKVRRAVGILNGTITVAPKTRSISAPGVVPAEAYQRPSIKNTGVFRQNGKLVDASDEETGRRISQNIVDEYFANRPKEAVNDFGQLKSSHAESELYRLNAHMGKYNINPKIYTNEHGVDGENINDRYTKIGPLHSLFTERDDLVAKVTGRPNYSVKNLEGLGSDAEGLNWKPTGRLARVNEAGVFGLTGAFAAPQSNTPREDTPGQREKRIRAAVYTPAFQKDSLPDGHKLVLRNGDMWIKRFFNKTHVPQFDELIHKNSDRIPNAAGKEISIPNFQAHRYSYDAAGADSYANIGGKEQRVHASTMHHYIISRDESGGLTVAPHPSMPESTGGLFAVHPSTGKPVSVSESSVLPSSEVREAVERGEILEGAGAKYENQLRPRPAAATSEPTEKDLIHNLWLKHGPSRSESGTSLVNVGDQIKQNWFDTAHKLATDHFMNNNPGAPVPSDKVGLVDTFFSKERKKAAYKRDAKNASDLGLM